MPFAKLVNFFLYILKDIKENLKNHKPKRFLKFFEMLCNQLLIVEFDFYLFIMRLLKQLNIHQKT